MLDQSIRVGTMVVGDCCPCCCCPCVHMPQNMSVEASNDGSDGNLLPRFDFTQTLTNFTGFISDGDPTQPTVPPSTSPCSWTAALGPSTSSDLFPAGGPGCGTGSVSFTGQVFNEDTGEWDDTTFYLMSILLNCVTLDGDTDWNLDPGTGKWYGCGSRVVTSNTISGAGTEGDPPFTIMRCAWTGELVFTTDPTCENDLDIFNLTCFFPCDGTSFKCCPFALTLYGCGEGTGGAPTDPTYIASTALKLTFTQIDQDCPPPSDNPCPGPPCFPPDPPTDQAVRRFPATTKAEPVATKTTARQPARPPCKWEDPKVAERCSSCGCDRAMVEIHVCNHAKKEWDRCRRGPVSGKYADARKKVNLPVVVSCSDCPLYEAAPPAAK